MNPTQNGVLQKDDNGYPVMGGTSSVDNNTVVNASFDPVTRRLLVDNSGSSSSGFQRPLTGSVDGVNTTFTWTTAPNALSIDNLTKQKTSSDGTTNWSGTTTTILTIAPTFDIFGVA